MQGVLYLFLYRDRVRTTSSVVSHTMCAAVTHHMCKVNLSDRQMNGDPINDLEMTIDKNGELEENKVRQEQTTGAEHTVL